MRFEHLTFPPQWKDYWTKYPHGMTILESLIDWATKTNDLIDNVNNWNAYLDDFVATFDENLKQEVTETVQSWIASGYIEVVISAALQTQIDDVELQLNNEVQRIDAQLADNVQQLNLKVDKVSGKGLSTEDYTTLEKEKVANIALKADITYVNSEIASISDGTPEAFNNLTDIQTAYPTGDSYVKLNLSDGYLYKWNGSTWVQGWLYQNTGIGDNSITPLKTNFVNIMKNKFDPAASSIGYQLLLAPSMDGSIAVNATYTTSGFIPVSSGDISVTKCRAIAVYDVNKSFIVGYNINPISEQTIPLANDGFIKVTFLNTDIETSMVEEGSEHTTYRPYGVYSFNSNVALEEKDLRFIELDNILLNKSALYFGDSITEGTVNGGGYAKIISENNSMSYTNYGVSGTTLAKRAGYTNSVLEKIKGTGDVADYIIIAGGVNDSGSGLVPLGVISEGYTATLDETTFCGALESVFKTALTKWSGKKIGYVTMHKMDTRPELGNFYSKAREICEKWSVPFCDFYFTGGMNTYIPIIKTTYTSDGTHPNALGYERYYTPMIEKWMRSL